MKCLFFVFNFLIFSITQSFAKEMDFCVSDSIHRSQNVENPDVYPKMKSCANADGTKESFVNCLMDYIRKNVRNGENVDGRAYILFKVNTHGKAEKIRVRSLVPSLEQEAIRLLEEMPEFIPAQKGGKNVELSYTLPIVFQKVKEPIKQENYIENPDIYAKWESCKESDGSLAGLRKCIRGFLHKAFRDKESKDFFIIRMKIDSEGNSAVENVSVRKEADLPIGDEIAEVLNKQLPKFIPALKGGKNVGIEFDMDLNLRKIEGLSADEVKITQAPQIGDNKISSLTPEGFKAAIDAHVIKNFVYPEQAHKNRETGTVFVTFRVNEDKSIEVLDLRGGSDSLQAEAYRLIMTLPVVAPGKEERGYPVPVTFMYPISFKLRL